MFDNRGLRGGRGRFEGSTRYLLSPSGEEMRVAANVSASAQTIEFIDNIAQRRRKVLEIGV